MKSILVVEDDETTLRVLVLALLGEKYLLAVARDGLEAKEMLAEHEFDVMVSDIQMPNCDGYELIEWVSEKQPNCTIIPMTCPSSTERVEGMLDLTEKYSLQFALSKPLSKKLLLQSIKSALLI